MEITNKCGLGDKLDCQPTTKSVTFNHWVKGCPMCNKIPWPKKEGKNVDRITYAPIYNLLTTEELKKYQIPQRA